ncbi:MAG: pyrroline-5-carboxylate reductase [Desulfovibrio sp.]|jgi:pyrroline-5-carboxylate reductase|nr:pyrroline-5-carboxylate reductase [Desulfovibrio sp.]
MSVSDKVSLGLVGYGSMGRALALGTAASEPLRGVFAVSVYEKSAANAEAALSAGFPVAGSAAELAAASDFILIAVKPHQVGAILEETAPRLTGDKVLLSIAAGITLDFLEQGIAGRCPVARIMPNTPALVGRGIFGFCFGRGVPGPAREKIRLLLGSLGMAAELEEAGMNAFTALSGSGPGYVFHFMESLAEAGASVGLDRELSRNIAVELLRGCAEMAAAAGVHPAVLREQVSSPAGTTLAGLNHLDRSGARGILVDAIRAAFERSKAMEKET